MDNIAMLGSQWFPQNRFICPLDIVGSLKFMADSGKPSHKIIDIHFGLVSNDHFLCRHICREYPLVVPAVLNRQQDPLRILLSNLRLLEKGGGICLCSVFQTYDSALK